MEVSQFRKKAFCRHTWCLFRYSTVSNILSLSVMLR